MTTVVCVLRSGGEYTPEWVWALKRGLARHAPHLDFLCLTDRVAQLGPWAVPLRHDWPGWWAKLEALRPDVVQGRAIYMDLDTLVVGALDELATYTGPFAMLSDFYRPRLAQSGVMLYEAGPGTQAAELYERFRAGAPGYMRRFRGDGEWLHAHVRPDRIQDLFPGQVVSFKVHARDGVPRGARLVCGHGQPRFSDPKAGWAHREWRRLAA